MGCEWDWVGMGMGCGVVWCGVVWVWVGWEERRGECRRDGIEVCKEEVFLSSYRIPRLHWQVSYMMYYV